MMVDRKTKERNGLKFACIFIEVYIRTQLLEVDNLRMKKVD